MALWFLSQLSYFPQLPSRSVFYCLVWVAVDIRVMPAWLSDRNEIQISRMCVSEVFGALLLYYHVVENDLGFLTVMSLLPRCEDDRCVSPCLIIMPSSEAAGQKGSQPWGLHSARSQPIKTSLIKASASEWCSQLGSAPPEFCMYCGQVLCTK